MARTSGLLLVIITLAAFAASYNLLMVMFHTYATLKQVHSTQTNADHTSHSEDFLSRRVDLDNPPASVSGDLISTHNAQLRLIPPPPPPPSLPLRRNGPLDRHYSQPHTVHYLHAPNVSAAARPQTPPATEVQNDARWKQQHLVVIAGNNLPATSSGAVAVAHGQEQEAAPEKGNRTLLGEEGPGKYHVLLTANDAKYVAWQSRIMFYHFQKVKRLNPGSAMGGFTRILHSGRPDNLMHEIPTVVVDPLPRGVDQGYVVLNRPYAFVQFMKKYDVREEYIFMAEPDHLLLLPIPLWATPARPVAFPFFYINTDDAKLGHVAQRFNPSNGVVDPIGNSPVIIHKQQLAQLAQPWSDLALKMKKDNEANSVFGWVLEMWAYALAAAQLNIRHQLHDELMLQPPYDTKFESAKSGKPSFIIHYTYGQDFGRDGKFTPGKYGAWRFDKRQYISRAPPKGLRPPPPGTNRVVVKLIEMINEATNNLTW